MPLTILAHEGSIYAGAKRGVTNEIGINMSRCAVRYYPEVNDTIPGLVGQTLLRVVSEKFSRDIQCEGEVLNSNAGVMIFTLASVLTFSNVTNEFTPNAGRFYLDEATVTASRGGWLSVSIKASARATL